MGLIKTIFSSLGLIKSTAEVFVPNRTKKLELEHRDFQTVHGQYSKEFQNIPDGFFNGIVNGLNRLPRPVMALGTVGLFCFAMINPSSFIVRMQGLSHVPEPLWWLLGAVVSFYFGARELHHLRSVPKNLPAPRLNAEKPNMRTGKKPKNPEDNAALQDWINQG